MRIKVRLGKVRCKGHKNKKFSQKRDILGVEHNHFWISRTKKVEHCFNLKLSNEYCSNSNYNLINETNSNCMNKAILRLVLGGNDF